MVISTKRFPNTPSNLWLVSVTQPSKVTTKPSNDDISRADFSPSTPTLIYHWKIHFNLQKPLVNGIMECFLVDPFGGSNKNYRVYVTYVNSLFQFSVCCCFMIGCAFNNLSLRHPLSTAQKNSSRCCKAQNLPPRSGLGSSAKTSR